MAEQARRGDLSRDDEHVAEQFDDLEQQRETARLGMWGFLATEVLFFGALILGYVVYRAAYPHAFADASHHLYKGIGAVNTAVLLLSSMTMGLAVHAAEEKQRRAVAGLLALTALLGALFLGIKGFEYGLDYKDGIVPVARFHRWLFANPDPAELFFVFYFAMTGLHALHLLIAVCMVLALLGLLSRRRLKPQHVEVAGLYWHFVDLVWVFLFPMFYLVS